MVKEMTNKQVRTSTLTTKVATIKDIEIFSHRFSNMPGTHIIIWNDDGRESDWETSATLAHAVNTVQERLVSEILTTDEIISKYADELSEGGDWKSVRNQLAAFYEEMKESEQQ